MEINFIVSHMTELSLTDVIVRINWAILMWWPHTASGQRIKALRRRPHSGFFLRSSRKLEEATPRYGYVLGATQQEMLRWLCTSMFTWVNIWQSTKYFLVWGLYEKNFLEPCRMSFSLAYYFCVPVSIHVVYIRVYIRIVLKICLGSSHASQLNTIIKFEWTNFLLMVIPRDTVCQWVLFL